MKEIMAVIRMRRTGATKKALIEAGVAGFYGSKSIRQRQACHRSSADRGVQNEAPVDGCQ